MCVCVCVVLAVVVKVGVEVMQLGSYLFVYLSCSWAVVIFLVFSRPFPLRDFVIQACL